jgi:phosphatidylglycerol:prolipoprotein diacylglycerol transferase
MIVAGFLGSRVFYGVVNAPDFARICADGRGDPRRIGEVLADCTLFLQVWQGGLVFYGGVVAAALVGWRFAGREGWSFARIGDLFAPGLALGHAFGRLGCFAAGCCFGKQGGGAWAVALPRESVAFDELVARGLTAPGATVTPPLHPAQLYEAAGNLLLFGVLMLARRRLRPRPGAVLLLYLGLYAALRFVVEIFRGDPGRRFVAAIDTPRLAAWLRLPPEEPIFFSVGQIVSLVVGAAVLVMLFRRRGQGFPATGTPPQTPAP